jgi:hypothetical protein
MTSKSRAMEPHQSNEGGSKKRHERRRDVRYELRGPVVFQWRRGKRELQEGEGLTRNVSRSGTFIESSKVPPLGAQLTVTAELSDGQEAAVQMRLRGTGTVRRIERSSRQPTGFVPRSDSVPRGPVRLYRARPQGGAGVGGRSYATHVGCHRHSPRPSARSQRGCAEKREER